MTTSREPHIDQQVEYFGSVSLLAKETLEAQGGWVEEKSEHGSTIYKVVFPLGTESGHDLYTLLDETVLEYVHNNPDPFVNDDILQVKQ